MAARGSRGGPGGGEHLLSAGSRRAALVALVATLVAAIAAVAGGASGARGRPAYLALGDSVSFGFRADAGVAEYRRAADFVGFPSYVASALGLALTNASCPGETTASYGSAKAPDNGCRAYRGAFPLHVRYRGTQRAFALAFLKTHPGTRLVSIQLGANDAFLLEDRCKDDPICVEGGVPALLASVAAHVGSILRAIRATGYRGRLIVVDYYSLDYSDLLQTALTSELNGAIARHAKADGASVANSFSLFERAAKAAGGKTCAAGLLTRLPGAGAGCDVHPSRAGARLLARAVELAYRAAKG